MDRLRQLSRRDALGILGLGIGASVLEGCKALEQWPIAFPSETPKEGEKPAEPVKPAATAKPGGGEAPLPAAPTRVPDRQQPGGQAPGSTRPGGVGLACGPQQDGTRVYTWPAPNEPGATLRRLPVSFAEGEAVVEFSIHDKEDFGGLARGVLRLPRAGSVWQVNGQEGVLVTLSGVRYCGTPVEVRAFMLLHHPGSLAQASRSRDGREPNIDNIGVYELDYEGRVARTLKKGRIPVGQVATRIFDLSFNENGRWNAVPLTGVDQ